MPIDVYQFRRRGRPRHLCPRWVNGVDAHRLGEASCLRIFTALTNARALQRSGSAAIPHGGAGRPTRTDDVAHEALDHLADGPTGIFGQNLPVGGSPFGAMSCRAALLAMSRGRIRRRYPGDSPITNRHAQIGQGVAPLGRSTPRTRRKPKRP